MPVQIRQAWQGQVRVLVSGGEGYFSSVWDAGRQRQEVLVRLPDARKPEGTLFSGGVRRGGDDSDEAVAVIFSIDANPTPEAKQRFYQAKAEHYAVMRRLDYAGAAWFRFQEAEARKIGGGSADLQDFARWNRSDDNHYDLFTGGRALAENLQLDRALGAVAPGDETVDVNSIQGISVAALDFSTLIAEASPAKDALAAAIPEDQHAIFFPSVAAARATFDQVSESNLPAVDSLAMESRESNLLERYQRQLGLRATKLAELLGPQVVKSLAITGSDPYFATGTDIAVLFESPSPQVLSTLLATQIAASNIVAKAAAAGKGEVAGVNYTSLVSPDRQSCSYLAVMDQMVVVTNSLAQLQHLAEVKQGKRKSLGALPEYTFFRMRYGVGQGEETAFVVLSDATIRRWCSPRWRIGEARRIAALARTAHATAARIAGTPLAADAGADAYGTLDFFTPIAELPLSKVTRAEADAYARWRDGYERNWRGVFDPIAIRFARSARGIGADITVMPLIAGSDYREMIELSRGAKLAEASGDPHGALGHVVFAFNHESAPARRWVGLGRTMMTGVKVDPLSWLGSSIALYADEDPFWAELAAAENADDFFERNFTRLPVALRVESTNGLKLAAFMTGVRAMVEQTAPNLTAWEPVEHAGLSYVKVTARGQGPGRSDVSICYAAMPDSLVISLSESVIRRSLERSAARLPAPAATAAAAGAPTASPTTKPALRPWLGESAALQVSARVGDLLFGMGREEFGRRLQQASWSNIPILNEWKGIAPAGTDPVAFHEKWWNEKLVCPAGGKYVWNEKLQTMESTAAGSPQSPRKVNISQLELKGFTFGNFGLTFEDNGLRARVELEKQQ
jgi:hypothetical protein